MDIEKVLRLNQDEEAVVLEEDCPLVRSLSMSRNMALSMMDEVSHMIKLPPTDDNLPSEDMKKSSSTSSLSRLNKKDKRKVSLPIMSSSQLPLSYESSTEIIQPITQPLSSTEMNDPEVIKTKRRDGFSVVESHSTLSQISFPLSSAATTRGGVKKNELLTGIVVSRWDNIVGPQCVYLWTEEATSIFYPGCQPPHLSGVIKYVTDHTVDHQDVDGNSLSPSSQRSTLCIVPDLSLVYMSISVRVPADLETVYAFDSSSSMTANDPDQPATSVPHAVSVLANLNFLSHYLLIRPLIANWLNEYAPKIGVLLCRNKLQNSMINSWCAEFCKTMTALKTCWVQEIPMQHHSPEIKPEIYRVNSSQQSPHLPNSNNGHKNIKQRDMKNNSKPRVLSREMDYLPPNLRHVSKSAWGCLLSSHLSTFGSSIIVGFDNLAVNQVIRFLLCFSSAQEGYCSRYSLATLPDTFMKGLSIQGLILGGIGEKSISYNQVSSNKHPFTYVELGSKFKVKQMNPLLHARQSTNILMQDLRALWTSSINVSPPDDPYPHPVKEAAGFVSQFLDDLSVLPADRRYGRLLLFRRVIHAKALSLISIMHSIRHLPIKERNSLIRQIPDILGFDDQEYTIVQVTAEKIKPGLMKLLI